MEYAKLLRKAWLNPSHEPWQTEVHRFENDHYNFLARYFRRWNGTTRRRNRKLPQAVIESFRRKS